MVRRFDYVIVGGSAGAVGCIEALRAVDRGGTIALIGEEGDRIYSRALIPYYLGGAIPREGMLYRPPDFCAGMGVVTYAGRRAVGLDPARKTVTLDGGEEVQYGKLLLATGGRAVVPPVPGLDKKNVFTFVNMADALALAETLPTARAAVVLGGGVMGLMAAETLKRRGLSVTVVELAPRVLAPVVDETASAMVEELFRAKGVPVRTGTTLTRVLGDGRAEAVVLTGGETVPCDVVVVAAGVVPRVELARAAGIAVNRGILVNEKMQTS
ncbi:MAG: NAD(P)/FAD-dependent oxidoreductase, partial [Firmicutes bacterium]|nr:NAD(P)/FAD-dependent oxidoreductase [Bacillota bacterium]